MLTSSTANITGRAQAPAGVVRPADHDAVVALVLAARSEHTPLYPVSTGLNFGYGGASPVTPGCTLVDLGALHSIVIDRAPGGGRSQPVAVIGPGVTQGMLYDYLEAHHPDLTFNVTGSARATSIIGNALDRGVGYFGPRKEDLFGLVVVCGSGEVLRTGFRRLEGSPLAHSHPYGLGPMLDGLFFQSNFGIVTSACFRLIPKRPCQAALSLALRQEADLPAFIDELAMLKREGLVESVTHIGNRARTQATLAHGVNRYLREQCGMDEAAAHAQAARVLALVVPGEWASLGAVTGTPAQVKANLAEVRRRMGKLARVRVVTERVLANGYALTHALRFIPFMRANAAAIAAVRPLHRLALGQPTDAAIDNLLWQVGRADLPAAQLDQSDCGLLFVNPALPLDGRFVAALVDALKVIATRFGHTLYMTINLETPTSLVAVINLLFDRRDEGQVANAHACADALLAHLHEEKLEVYRARADMMAALVARDVPYWTTISKLKQQFDPDNIIAPGRYNLAAVPIQD